MKRRSVLIGLLLFLSINLFPSHKGRVFVDSNKNGVYDSGEKLLKGVMVTDGQNVVLTNSKGEFELVGHPKERFITITTPSGYKPSQAHYINIKKEIISYDFALDVWNNRIAKDGSHKFIQISDTEIFNTIDHERWTHAIRDYAKNEDIAFVIHTGDICYEKGLKAHIKLMNSENMACPMYYLIGNHDLVKGEYGEQLFESIYGPTWFSFDYGNVHYIVTPMPSGDYAPSYKEEDVYAWLKNDLALVDKGTPIVCFNHTLKSYTDQFVFQKNENEKLVLSDYNLKAWFYGHWHNNFVRQQGKVKTISTATLDKGGIDHSTSAFRVISVDKKGNTETQLRYTYIKGDINIASIGNENATINERGKVPLVVNAYNTGALTKRVTYSLNDGEDLIKDNQNLDQNTDWAWSTEISIPTKYANKKLFVEVKAEFNNGEVAKSQESFVYQPNEKSTIKLKDNWNTLLGNSEHIGYSTDSLRFPIKLLWINNVEANLFMSSPIVNDGVVYVAAVDEDLKGEGGIYALDAKKGAIKWFYQTRNSIKNTIAIEGENVFAQDAEGYLYAVNKQAGKLSWEKKLNIDGLPLLHAGLTVKDGIVYAGSGKGFAAFDAKNGNQKWINKDWSQNQGTTATLTANNDVVISGTQWGAMYANNIQSGKMLWSQSKNGISNRASSPALHNGLAYFVSSQSLFILDAKSGNILLSKELAYKVDVTSTPLVTDKLIIFATVSDGLIALNKENYSEVWKMNTQAALVYTVPYSSFPAKTIETSPVRVGEHVVFGASDGFIYAVNMNTGKVDWKHKTGAPIFGSIAISGNTFFVTDFGGNVYAFSSNTFPS